MRIYSMTATFGKLDHETLILQPGLNILQAPNEWGKSTWCAFLTAMFYGLDTRAKTTKTSLADKEHFAPWSGKPMSGRVDLNWNGRDLTIERTTKGRIPMGEFRAYETKSGLAVPELDGANCGAMLLGIERSVFVRSGFIRLNDLRVTDDETLRRRLNALVTTGDESGRAEKLASGLKELKNRIRYNRMGLLPQAEAEQKHLASTLQELQLLQGQVIQTRERMDQVADWQLLLENHRTALEYDAVRKNAEYVSLAEQERLLAQEKLEKLDAQCALYPDRETAAEVLAEIHRLHRTQMELEAELAALSEPREPEELSGIFAGMTGDEAISRAKADRDLHWSLAKRSCGLLLLGALLAAAGVGLALWKWVVGAVIGILGLAVIVTDRILKVRRRNRKQQLEDHYGSRYGDRWLREAERYAAKLHFYEQENQAYERQRRELHHNLDALRANVEAATEGRGLEACREEWETVLEAWDARERACGAWQLAENHCSTLKAMAKSAPEPSFPDRLTYSEEETAALMLECAAERQHLENRLGQLQGRMDTIGTPEEMERKLKAVNSRIGELEKTYTALILAQETLSEASAQLQRRFAPRISRRTRELMEAMTGGRYSQLQLRDDLSLRAGAGQEDTMRDVLWRSDGTVDQLYLALRLAVAGELAPHAPLILDDALARFDDARTKAALEILKQEADRRQVILFTCHSREKNLLDQKR